MEFDSRHGESSVYVKRGSHPHTNYAERATSIVIPTERSDEGSAVVFSMFRGSLREKYDCRSEEKHPQIFRRLTPQYDSTEGSCGEQAKSADQPPGFLAKLEPTNKLASAHFARPQAGCYRFFGLKR